MHRRTLATAHLDDNDEKILEKACGRKSDNFALWGPLAPRDAISSCVTGGILNWALQHVGRFSAIAELGTCVQSANAFIDSAIVAREVRRFEHASAYEPDGKFMKRCNLVFLRERLRALNVQYLTQVDGLEMLALPLNADNVHWSMLLYFCKTNEFLHLDSIDKFNNSLALSMSKLLAVLNFVPKGSSFWPGWVQVNQSGSWECGYAAIVQAFFFAGVLPRVTPECTDPRVLIQKTDLLKRFIRALLQRSRQARQINAFASARLDNIYSSK